jgi:hypothetical protein
VRLVTGVAKEVEAIHSPENQKAMLWEDGLIIKVKGGEGLDLKDLSDHIIAKYEMSFFDRRTCRYA